MEQRLIRLDSADKIGSVAIRATQLNQLLGGVCKHQREDEGHESTEFTHYYLKMGHALEGASPWCVLCVGVKVEVDLFVFLCLLVVLTAVTDVSRRQ